MAIKCLPGVSTSLNLPLGNSPPKVLEPSPAEQESLLARKGLFERLPPSIQRRATTTARPRSNTRLANELTPVSGRRIRAVGANPILRASSAPRLCQRPARIIERVELADESTRRVQGDETIAAQLDGPCHDAVGRKRRPGVHAIIRRTTALFPLMAAC